MLFLPLKLAFFITPLHFYQHSSNDLALLPGTERSFVKEKITKVEWECKLPQAKHQNQPLLVSLNGILSLTFYPLTFLKNGRTLVRTLGR